MLWLRRILGWFERSSGDTVYACERCGRPSSRVHLVEFNFHRSIWENSVEVMCQSCWEETNPIERFYFFKRRIEEGDDPMLENLGSEKKRRLLIRVLKNDGT